ncbi:MULTISPECIES: DUF3489 domain-containing protein [unclassified Polynucleobacter]|jgi:hypothetical protein|uniref:DUF3489 domain-containing protein n=1 Tax=unclassified Polynucleobacter TaxID=2640945 RepID=UPI001C0D5EC0|nr:MULTISPECIES: DUF3489 domain-containing protein [unclassified Polynucleobacter]MBU3590419.1 DUF3489 domain-containing protein [Polynucleobacter sp. 78F-HAINBA]MCX7237117.1 DUF3489 domain-containing protein [Polynucleobacter sp.]
MRTAISKKGITKSIKPTTKFISKKTAPKKVIAAAKTKGIEPIAPLVNPAPATPGSPKSKQSQLIALLKNPQGVEIKELMNATGWQAHSVRGVISGVIRKRLGLTVISQKMDGVQHYRIEVA